uniref:Uncharacterized protein AlNc14C384G11250 n=1 Tax=Albugo laibachii Nc14 TaxID=890382 RepID=F0WYI8_9STRA|nr:conserved hypothetical protein [Albugo laibachii Nc14]|eukprot:CCA26545.1 conserved hypothetical protein [Albugo laibachii Nc14]
MFRDCSESWTSLLYRYIGALTAFLLSFFACKWLQHFLLTKSHSSTPKTRKIPKKKKKKSKKRPKSIDSDSSIHPNLPLDECISPESSPESTTRPFQLEIPQKSPLTRYQIDQKVIARYQRGSEWFPATVEEIRRGNQYHLRYDDGEIEYRVPYECILPADANEFMKAARLSIHNEDESDVEEDWQLVGRKEKPMPRKPDANRKPSRRKENKKLVKELLRAQAQAHGLHARWKANAAE